MFGTGYRQRLGLALAPSHSNSTRKQETHLGLRFQLIWFQKQFKSSRQLMRNFFVSQLNHGPMASEATIMMRPFLSTCDRNWESTFPIQIEIISGKQRRRRSRDNATGKSRPGKARHCGVSSNLQKRSLLVGKRKFHPGLSWMEQMSATSLPHSHRCQAKHRALEHISHFSSNTLSPK